MLPFLPDRYNPPNTLEERINSAVSHCWVEEDVIVSRLRQIRKEHQTRDGNWLLGGRQLDRVYISTNADGDWIKDLKETLRADGWENIVATPDLALTWEEEGVDSAVGKYQFFHPSGCLVTSLMHLQIWSSLRVARYLSGMASQALQVPSSA